MHKKNNGFTLIEVIVVVSILSVITLAVITILNPVLQIQKARDTQRKADLSQIQKALESYYQDNGSYPQSTSSPYQIPGAAWNTPWRPYMNLLPKDPSSGRYVYYSDGQSYYLYANLERGSKDTQACANLNANECGNKPFSTPNACGGPCNYGVSSPDKTP